MSKSVYDRGLMKPADIAKLQRVFDEGCMKQGIVPDSTEARELALTILALHNAGMVDEAMLKDVAGLRRTATKSA